MQEDNTKLTIYKYLKHKKIRDFANCIIFSVLIDERQVHVPFSQVKAERFCHRLSRTLNNYLPPSYVTGNKIGDTPLNVHSVIWTIQ